MTHYMKTARKIVESRTQDTFGAIGCNLDLEHIATFFDETECDHSFQRKGGFEGGSGWTKERALAYMENMFKGCTFNKIMVADAKKCLEYAKECGDEKSIVYYQNVLDKGKKYVSIDGNNTASTIARYASNKLKVNKKYLTDHGDQGEQLRHLYAYRLDIVKLERILLDEMTELFRHLNTSTALNKQEYRQARISPLAEYVRNTANKPEVRKTFEKLGVFKNSAFDKRFHEEFTAQLLLHYVFPRRAKTQNTLNVLYENNDDVSAELKSRLVDNLGTLVRIFADQEDVNKTVFSKGKFYSVMNVIDNLKLQKYNIINFNAFREWFIMRDVEWIAEDQTTVVADQKEESYSHWCKFYYSVKENGRLDKKWNDCLDTHIPKLEEANIIARPRARPRARRFSMKEKLVLCDKQDWKTREGKDIPPSVAIAKGGIHGDHVRSRKDGGRTTLENGEVMFPVDNLKKSSKL